MPALPADIGAAIRGASIAQWSDPDIKERYPSARDALTAPSDGYFDTLQDALTAIAARYALIGTERRRFSVVINDLVFIDPTTALPTVRLVDGEQVAADRFLVSRVSIDLDAETTTLEIFG